MKHSLLLALQKCRFQQQTVKLKHRTGVDILAEIKKIAPATRAIMLTAYPTDATTQESFRLGASEYCTKPIDNEVLEETVTRVLNSG